MSTTAGAIFHQRRENAKLRLVAVRHRHGGSHRHRQRLLSRQHQFQKLPPRQRMIDQSAPERLAMARDLQRFRGRWMGSVVRTRPGTGPWRRVIPARLLPANAGGRGAARPPEPTAPAPGRYTRVITGLWAALVVAAFAGAALALVARGDLKATDLTASLGNAVAVVAYATLGTLIVRRAGNLIGWLMLGESAAAAFLSLASMYAVLGVATFPGALPAAKQVGTLAEVSFTGVAFTLAFMVLLFPTGQLPSRRWRPLAAAGFLLAGLTAVGLVVSGRDWCSSPRPAGPR